MSTDIDFGYISNPKMEEISKILGKFTEKQIDKIINHIEKNIRISPEEIGFHIHIPALYGDEEIEIEFRDMEFNLDQLIECIYFYYDEKNKKESLIKAAHNLNETAKKLIKISEELDV